MAEISLFIKEYRMFIEIFRIFFTWLFASLPSKKSGGSQFVNGQLAFILRKPENGRFRGYAKLSHLQFVTLNFSASLLRT